MRATEIKPEFYKNEQLVECSVWARLIFPGLVMLADREGRLEDRPKRIKVELLPYDNDVDMDALLNELAEQGLIVRYETSGQRYIWIPANKCVGGSIRELGMPSAEWQRLRVEVFERDAYTCAYCGSVVEHPHCDHVFPLSRGGKSILENLVTACPACNCSKGGKTLEEWRGY